MPYSLQQIKTITNQTGNQAQKSSFQKLKPVEYKPKGFLETASDVVGEGTSLVGEGMMATGIPQVFGRATGVASGVIGGATGAVLGTGLELYKATKGKGFDVNKIADTIKSSYRSNKEFGSQVGLETGKMLPIGSAGKIPAAIIGTQQVYEGGKGLREALKEGNSQKAIESGINLGLGLAGTYHATKAKGLFLDKTVIQPIKQQLKSEANYLSGGRLFNPEVKINKQAETFRKIVKPGISEIKNAEVLGNKDLNDAFKIMAKEGVKIEKGPEGKMVTTNSVVPLQEQIKNKSALLRAELESKPRQVFDLNKVAENVKKKIDNMRLSALERKAMKEDVDEVIGAELETIYPKQVIEQMVRPGKEIGGIKQVYKTKLRPLVDGVGANDIKSSMWKMGYNQMKPTAHKTARLIGGELREQIENAYKDKRINAINKEIGDYSTAVHLLNKAHGRIIPGGFMGREIAGVIGSIAGASTPVPYAGPIIGNFLGKKAFEAISNPEMRTARAGIMAKEKLPPSLLQKAEKIQPGLSIKDVSGNIYPLIKEAKKYKSAEEFVKKQPVVYHGSSSGPLERFDNKKGGAFFTEEYSDAAGYAGDPDNVYEGYLHFKKPLIIDAKGAKWDNLNTKFGKTTQEIVGNAEKAGYDGVTFKKIVDNVMDTAGMGESTVHYAIKPEDAFVNESQLIDIWNKAHNK